MEKVNTIVNLSGRQMKSSSLSLWPSVLCEKAMFCKLAKMFHAIYETQCSLLYLQEPITGPCPEGNSSSS
jgi:hypothetical protein